MEKWLDRIWCVYKYSNHRVCVLCEDFLKGWSDKIVKNGNAQGDIKTKQNKTKHNKKQQKTKQKTNKC